MLGRSLLKLRVPQALRMPRALNRVAAVRMPLIRMNSTAAAAEETPGGPTNEDRAHAKSREDKAPSDPNKTLLDRGYEWYPVIGLGTATAVTQEWLIADEMWVIGGCFYGVLYSMYVLGHDRLWARYARDWKKRVTHSQAGMGIYLDQLRRYELLEEFALSHADELRNLYAEEAKISAMAVEYQNLKHKFDTRSAILQKLKSIEQLEDDTRRAAVVALSAKAAEYVANAYKAAPAAVKQQQIESGITRIVPELTTRSIALNRTQPKKMPENDPVKLLFDEFLSQPRTFEQLGVENHVQRYLDRQAKAAKTKH